MEKLTMFTAIERLVAVSKRKWLDLFERGGLVADDFKTRRTL
jgi:hypothetical protein